MQGCFNCRKQNLCTEPECMDTFYKDNPYIGSQCKMHEFEEEDEFEDDEDREPEDDELASVDEEEHDFEDIEDFSDIEEDDIKEDE